MEKKDLGNTILIAKKPISAYILATRNVMQKFPEIVLKARGKNISTAVNIAEIVKRDGLKIKKIETSTEKFVPKEGGNELSVSAIEILLIK